MLLLPTFSFSSLFFPLSLFLSLSPRFPPPPPRNHPPPKQKKRSLLQLRVQLVDSSLVALEQLRPLELEGRRQRVVLDAEVAVVEVQGLDGLEPFQLRLFPSRGQRSEDVGGDVGPGAELGERDGSVGVGDQAGGGERGAQHCLGRDDDGDECGLVRVAVDPDLFIFGCAREREREREREIKRARA